MARFSFKKRIDTYLKKKWYSILSDMVFVLLLVLLIIPSTRTEVASFFIRLTSFPPSTLDIDDQIKINNQSKNWQILDMEGNAVSLESLNDKPIFLNFWATWCPPCIAELPGIAELYEKYGGEINFILVSNESRAKVRAFSKKNNFEELPFYQSNNVPNDFASQSIPTTFIISKEGTIVLSKKGVASWNSGRVEDIIEKLISK
ncbi:MAG: TlpA family protein disulfide reductase [Bacteroidetes bacterium]|nr:TlpA family protein disulfide reductase [Bacteroidota bacterium]